MRWNSGKKAKIPGFTRLNGHLAKSTDSVFTEIITAYKQYVLFFYRMRTWEQNAIIAAVLNFCIIRSGNDSVLLNIEVHVTVDRKGCHRPASYSCCSHFLSIESSKLR